MRQHKDFILRTIITCGFVHLSITPFKEANSAYGTLCNGIISLALETIQFSDDQHL